MHLVKEKKYGQIYTLYSDGEPWRDVHSSIIKEIETKEEFDRLELKGAKFYALKRLAARNTSSFELKKLLEERLVRTPTIEKVIAECQQLGYLDDLGWIEAVVRREVRCCKGPKWIAQKLSAKGVPQERAEQEVARFYPDENAQLKAFIKKEQNKGKSRDKLIASLIRRGFSWEEIQNNI